MLLICFSIASGDFLPEKSLYLSEKLQILEK